MAQTKKMGRPKDPDARTHATILRMNDAEKALLDAVVTEVNRRLKEQHLKVSTPDVLRSLVAKEADALGLTKAPETGARKRRGSE